MAKPKTKIFKYFTYTNIYLLILIIAWIVFSRDIIYLPDPNFLYYNNRGVEYLELFEKSLNSNFIQSANIINAVSMVVFFVELAYMGRNTKYRDYIEDGRVRLGIIAYILFFLVFNFIAYRFIYYYYLSYIFIPTFLMGAIALYLSRSINSNIENNRKVKKDKEKSDN